MSLSERLRAAALERAERSGQNIDGVVLEPTGVIDLREMARDAARDVDNRVQLPRLDDEHPTTERSLGDTSLWRRLRPLPGTTPEPTLDLTDEPVVDVTDPPVVDEGPAPIADLPPLWEPTIVDPEPTEPPEAVVIDLGDDVVTADCDRCGSTGRRDLFDRFSRTEYYSCDDCGHMWQQRLDT